MAGVSKKEHFEATPTMGSPALACLTIQIVYLPFIAVWGIISTMQIKS
jgi:hypothetical protein